MRFTDRLLFFFGGAVHRIGTWAWHRFLVLSLIGKGLGVALSVFGAGWIAGKLGLQSLAHELGSAAWLVLSLVITAVVIRHIWLRFTHRSRYPLW